MRRWIKPALVVVGVVVGRWFAGNVLWQLFTGAGGGAALAILTAPLTGLEGTRLYLFAVALAVFFLGAILYAVKFLPLPPEERADKERERSERQYLRDSLVPLQAEMEYNRDVLEIAQGEGLWWRYDRGERLESDQWNNRKQAITLGGRTRDFWLAMERAHRDFDRLNREAIEAASNPVDLTIPDITIMGIAFARLRDAEAKLTAISAGEVLGAS